MLMQRRTVRRVHDLERGRGCHARPAVAAVEFALVVGILFTIFLGIIEIGRAIMVLGAVANAARCGARSGALSSGDYTAVRDAVTTSLDKIGIPSSAIAIIVTVDGIAVTSDATFKAAAVPGSAVAVQVQVSYSSVSWFPAGSSFFLSAKQQLSETVVMRKEG